ncbi:exosortase/archaeosortase family protein [Microbacterium sp. AG790]|uniref:exosortase/archaeosortase family protein n=1 Tax=Microbacterium sp. AG790 TaxID=2183995 RepID=UPI000EB49AFF|nr:exosortase/archaeosortase family protein [Microbacterium sp. AG790]RKS86708.1 exosortase/archaeosortase family protein [Microbacterium sp. AG790]
MVLESAGALSSGTALKWVTRLVLALSLVGLMASAFICLPAVLAIEADLAARVLSAVFRVPSYAPFALPYIVFVDDPTYVLQITPECSAVFLTAPFAAAAALLLLSRRFSPARILLALLLSVTVIVIINEVRIAFIGAALVWWGIDGYGWSHTVTGSLMSVGAIVGAVAMSYLVMKRRKQRASPEILSAP